MSWYELASAAGESGHSSDLIFVIPGIGLEVTSVVTTMWVIMGLLILLGWLTTRSMQRLPEGRLQNIMEMVVEALWPPGTGDGPPAGGSVSAIAGQFSCLSLSRIIGLIRVPVIKVSRLSCGTGVRPPAWRLSYCGGAVERHSKKGLKSFKHFADLSYSAMMIR